MEKSVENQKILKSMLLKDKMDKLIKKQEERLNVEKQRLVQLTELNLLMTKENNKMYLSMKCSQLEILKSNNELQLEEINLQKQM